MAKGDVEKRRKGRPRTGATPVMVRLLPPDIDAIDNWREAETDQPGRPEAVRRLVRKALRKDDKES